jgi:predicted  nucleic acid-binding Zn ribbon protein
MHVADLTFTALSPDKPVDQDAADHALNGLLHALRMNGQVCGREFTIARTPDGYRLTVMLPEPGALGDEYRNQYVRKAIETLGTAGLGGPHVAIVGADPDGPDPCQCSAPSSCILYTGAYTLESPVRCGGCFLPVPLYRLPPTYQGEDYYDVVVWESDYQSCEMLWFNSRVLERATLRQLEDSGSSLNRQGLEVRDRIQGLTRIPTYYFLFRHSARSARRELERRCPGCGGAWLLDTP